MKIGWWPGRLGRALLLSAAAALAVQPLVAQTRSLPVLNGGFEDGEVGLPPTSWGGTARATRGGPPSAFRTEIDTDNPRSGSASVRLERIAEPAAGMPPFGTVAQTVDAAPWRGRRIRMRAAVRTDAADTARIGLWLRVDRAERRMGFFDNMQDRPIRSADWADYVIEGDVATDAERIVFGLLLAGDGRAWMDDVRIEDVGPATAPAASAVTPAEMVDRAIALLREHHINSASTDWDRVAAEARAQIQGSTDARAAYPAIQHVIDALGERHTFLRPAPAWSRPGAPTRESFPLPTAELMEERIGLVRLPAFAGSVEEAERYETILRDILLRLDARGVCGWIVDLRGNGGGNMWPMLNGLDPLLGAAPFGSFRTPSGRESWWVRRQGEIVAAGESGDGAPSFSLGAARAPVAVLLGPETASSGEMVAIAFVGREQARSFGAPTAGLSTANSMHTLPDGSWLVITSSHARDRIGREYGGAIQPDEVADDAVAAALGWLGRQQSCR